MQNELALETCLQSLFPCRSCYPEREDCVPERWQGWRAGKKQSLTLPALWGSVAVLGVCGTGILGFHFTEVFHIQTLFWVKPSRANGWSRMSCTSFSFCFLPLAVSTPWPVATTSSRPVLAIDEEEHCTVSSLELHVSIVGKPSFY